MCTAGKTYTGVLYEAGRLLSDGWERIQMLNLTRGQSAPAS